MEKRNKHVSTAKSAQKNTFKKTPREHQIVWPKGQNIEYIALLKMLNENAFLNNFWGWSFCCTGILVN